MNLNDNSWNGMRTILFFVFVRKRNCNFIQDWIWYNSFEFPLLYHFFFFFFWMKTIEWNSLYQKRKKENKTNLIISTMNRIQVLFFCDSCRYTLLFLCAVVFNFLRFYSFLRYFVFFAQRFGICMVASWKKKNYRVNLNEKKKETTQFRFPNEFIIVKREWSSRYQKNN